MNTNEFPYKSVFAANLHQISDTELDTYLAKADLNQLKPLMPDSIDLIKNKDLIGCVVNVAVAGRVNANGDSITTKAAARMAENFLYKYVNIGHKSHLVKGSIVNYGFSRFGSEELITKEEVILSDNPVNISVAFVLWKNTLTNDFIQLLEQSVDPTSSKYKFISASWELLFKEYDIAVGGKNINESQLFTSAEDKSNLEKYLQANGGNGKKDEKLVYRVIKGENEADFLIPAGIGLVEHPAAEVKGLEIVAASKQKDITITMQFDDLKEEIKASVQDAITKEIQNFTNNQKSVTNNVINQTNKFMDKQITKIEDINEEFLKQSNASVEIVKFIKDKLQEESQRFIAEQSKVEATQKSLLDTQKELTEVKAGLLSLQQEMASKAAQELFSQRMSHFDDIYELSQEERKLVASEIKDVTEEIFTSIKDKYAILLKEKSKEVLAAKKKAEKDAEKLEEEDEEKEECDAKCGNKNKKAKASEENKGNEAIDDALKTGTDANAKIPNAATPEVSFADKFAEFFSVEKCVEIQR